MYTLVLLAVTACVLCLALTPLARDWCLRAGLVDLPDQKRKLHLRAVPRTGGIPILLSYCGAVLLLQMLPVQSSAVVAANRGTIDLLLVPVGLIFLVGLLDDCASLRPWQKLLGQVTAAGWAYHAGLRLATVGEYNLRDWQSFILTVGWLVLCCNAFNLIDGIDGLAAGVGLTATLATLAAGVWRGDLMLAMATAPLAGCLLAFLRYNFNPASIFLGDSGSLLIGFLLGAYAIIWSQSSATMLGLSAPAMALALPLLEVLLSVGRRFLANDPMFAGDRGHIHHRLLDQGFSTRGAALLLYAGCLVGAILSLLQTILKGRMAAGILLLFGLITWTGVRFLKYAEFSAASSFFTRRMRPLLSGHVTMERLAVSLDKANSVEECWQAIQRAGQSLGYAYLNARLSGITLETTDPPARTHSWWQMRLNMPGGNFVNVTQKGGAEKPAVLLINFVELLGRALPAKLEALADQSPAPLPRYSSTTTVISSDCSAPSANAATPS